MWICEVTKDLWGVDRREGGQCRVNPKVIGRFSSTGCQWNCLVDKDTGHHEVCYDDEDNHRIVLVDALEVPVHKGDRRETSL